MDLMLTPRRQFIFQVLIQIINVGCVQLLQTPLAKCRNHMHAQDLLISFNRAAASTLFLSPRAANRDPMVDPITKSHAGRVNVSSVVARFQQLAEFRSRLGPRAAERHRIALLADAISGCRSPSIAGSCAMPSAAAKR